MGVDIKYNMRYNLDVSSVDALAADLQRRLGYVAVEFVNPMEKEIIEDFGLSYHNNAGLEGDMLLEDCYHVARLLLRVYGDDAVKIVADHQSSQCLIDEISEVIKGRYSYIVPNDRLEELGKPSIWHITNTTLSGNPNFLNQRWWFFSYALDSQNRVNNDYLERLIDERRQLFESLKPILIGKYIYYYPDYIEDEMTYDSLNFDDIPEYYEIFDLSEYILNADSKQIFNNKDIKYVIRDDFKDLK